MATATAAAGTPAAASEGSNRSSRSPLSASSSTVGLTRKSCPTDLSDDPWERLEPLLPAPKSGTPWGGRSDQHPGGVKASLSLLQVGALWRLLPHNFPAWQRVYTCFGH
ncbi:MAG: transposase [Gemmataceae bacterium]